MDGISRILFFQFQVIQDRNGIKDILNSIAWFIVSREIHFSDIGIIKADRNSILQLQLLKDLPQGAKVGIQNDPSNGNRALLLLQKNGILKLKAGVGKDGVNATPLDVIENPKGIKLIELDSAQLPRSLDDLAAASINTDYAVKAGLSPTKDAIAIEDLKGPYANLIAVRAQDRNKPWVKKLVAAYESPDVKNFIDTQFKGSIIPAF